MDNVGYLTVTMDVIVLSWRTAGIGYVEGFLISLGIFCRRRYSVPFLQYMFRTVTGARDVILDGSLALLLLLLLLLL